MPRQVRVIASLGLLLGVTPAGAQEGYYSENRRSDADEGVLAELADYSTLSSTAELRLLGRRSDYAALKRLGELQSRHSFAASSQQRLLLVTALTRFLTSPYQQEAERLLIPLAVEPNSMLVRNFGSQETPAADVPAARLELRSRGVALRALCMHGTKRGLLAVVGVALSDQQPAPTSSPPDGEDGGGADIARQVLRDCRLNRARWQDLESLVGAPVLQQALAAAQFNAMLQLSPKQLVLLPATTTADGLNFLEALRFWARQMRLATAPPLPDSASPAIPDQWLSLSSYKAALEVDELRALRLLGAVLPSLPEHLKHWARQQAQARLASKTPTIRQAASFLLHPETAYLEQPKAQSPEQPSHKSQLSYSEPDRWSAHSTRMLEFVAQGKQPNVSAWLAVAPLAARLNPNNSTERQRLKDWLHHLDPRMRAAAAWGLGHNHFTSASLLLLDAYDEEGNVAVRRALATALFKQTPASSKSAREPHHAYLLRRVQEALAVEPEAEVRAAFQGQHLRKDWSSPGFFVQSGEGASYVIDARGLSYELKPGPDGFVALLRPYL